MNKFLSLALLIFLFAPLPTAHASHFSCTVISTTETTATLTIQSNWVSTQYVKILDTSIPMNDNTQAPQTTEYPSANVIKNTYQYLNPATPYKAIVFGQDNLFVEDIKGCTFTTKSHTTTGTGGSTSTTPPADPSTTGSFKMSVTKQGTTGATIYATSLLSINATGWIEVRKSTDTTAKICPNMLFPSGAPANPCPVTNLTPGSYTARVVATGVDHQPYGAAIEFTMAGSTTGTTTGSTTQPGTSTTGTSGTPAAGTSTGSTFTPQSPTSSSTTPTGGGVVLDIKLQNPLKVSTITEAIKFFVDVLIKIAIPFIVVFFIWAGLKFILAQGKPEELKKAKHMFWYTIIGTLLILGAWTITNAIIGTVNSLTN